MKTIKKISKYFLDYSEEILLFLTLLFKFLMLYVGDYQKSIPCIIYIALVAALLVANFIFKYLRKVNLKKIILIIALTGIVFALSNDKNINLVVLASINFVEKGSKKYIKAFGISLLIGLMISILLSSFGAIEAITAPASKKGFYLFDFGLGHHNTPMMFYFVICLCFLISFKSAWIRILLIIGSVVLVILTYSRTGFLCILFVIALDITRFINFKSKTVNIMFILLPIIMIGVSFYIPLGLNTPKIDELLSHRPSLLNICIENFKWFTFRGNDFSKVLIWDGEPLIVDNFFLNVLYGKGIIVFLFYISIYSILFYFVEKNENYTLKICLIGFMIYGLFEANLYSFVMNFPLGMLLISFLSRDPEAFRFKELEMIEKNYKYIFEVE